MIDAVVGDAVGVGSLQSEPSYPALQSGLCALSDGLQVLTHYSHREGLLVALDDKGRGGLFCFATRATAVEDLVPVGDEPG